MTGPSSWIRRLRGAARRSAPRVISLSIVRNEQDIIEPFIRHTASLVDAMVILDHGSVDETRAIALDCARELGSVVVGDTAGFAHTQSERMTRLLHDAQSAFLADFVLFLDADEFVGVADRASLLAMLETIPTGGVGYLEWRTFVLAPGEGHGPSDPPRSMRRRRSTERRVFRKAILRLDGACRPELVVEAGNHDVLTGSGERLDGVYFDEPKLLHFPVRSRRQLVTKGVVGWLALRAADPAAAAAGRGFQWRDAFERVMSTSDGPDAVDASAASLAYARDAREGDLADTIEECPPMTYVRRYSTGVFGEPLVLIARSWERSLEPPGPTAGVDEAAIRFLVETGQPASVLHLGCGTGAVLLGCKRLGVPTVLGVDRCAVDETVLSDGDYLRQEAGEPLRLGRTFDLVIWSADGLVERSSESLDDVVGHASGVVLADGRRSLGNSRDDARSMADWLDRWAMRGWFADEVASLGVRCLALMPSLRHGAVVLRRDGRRGSHRVLRAIEVRRSRGSVPPGGQRARADRHQNVVPTSTTAARLNQVTAYCRWLLGGRGSVSAGWGKASGRVGPSATRVNGTSVGTPIARPIAGGSRA